MASTHSSEKLQMLTDMVNKLPTEVLIRVKSVSLDWKTITNDNGYIESIVPIVKIEMKS